MHDGTVCVKLRDGSMMTVKNDGRTGYDFADDYLNRMEQHYSGHLEAADAILRRMAGPKYVEIRADRRLYRSHLAVVSLNCAFGEMDGTPDCDENGDMHFEFTRCPFRATCPFNGYDPNNGSDQPLCCNPRYELNLTLRQRQVADLLVNSRLTACEMAAALNMPIKSVQNATAEVFFARGREHSTRADVTTLREEDLLIVDNVCYWRLNYSF